MEAILGLAAMRIDTAELRHSSNDERLTKRCKVVEGSMEVSPTASEADIPTLVARINCTDRSQQLEATRSLRVLLSEVDNTILVQEVVRADVLRKFVGG